MCMCFFVLIVQMLDDMVSYGKVSNLKPVQRILLTWYVSLDLPMDGWIDRCIDPFIAK